MCVCAIDEFNSFINGNPPHTFCAISGHIVMRQRRKLFESKLINTLKVSTDDGGSDVTVNVWQQTGTHNMFVYLCRKKNKWTIEDWFNISPFEQRRVKKNVRLFSAIWLQCLSSFFSRFCMIVSTAYIGGSGGCGSNSIPIIITNETNEPSPMYGKLLLVLAWDELLKLL